MENDAALTGPRITDAEFFKHLDPQFPGLKEAIRAAEEGDIAAARRLFAAAARASLQPERFF